MTIRKPSPRALAVFLGAFVAITLAYGMWTGFPVQDDTYLTRLLRLGGPERIAHDHPDRPVYGLFLASSARLFGEHKGFYIAIGLVAWLAFAAEVIWLWIALFPEWASAWPVVGLAVLCPIVNFVQFSTVTTVFPCLLPVMLVLMAVLLALGATDRRRLEELALFVLAGVAVVVSEYGLATTLGAIAFLAVLGRWRSGGWLLGGASLGYVLFQAAAKLSVRRETNPQLQAAHFLDRPWTRPFRVLSAAWHGVAGAWGKAAAGWFVDWSSKSTLLATAVGVVVAAACALFFRAGDIEAERSPMRRIAALLLGVFASLYPAIAIMGWPLKLYFETRFFLPALPFAACATVALAAVALRPRWMPAALFVLAFLAADGLVRRAHAEGTTQRRLEAAGARLRPLVAGQTGLVLIVCRDRMAQSAEEVGAKASANWPIADAERLVVLRPPEAEVFIGTRRACPDLASLRLRREPIRWPRAPEPIRLVLWDQGDWEDGEVDPEPYYRGCPAS